MVLKIEQSNYTQEANTQKSRVTSEVDAHLQNLEQQAQTTADTRTYE